MEHDDATGKRRPIPECRERFVDNPITRNKRGDFERALKFQVPNPLDAVYWETDRILRQYNTKSLHHEYDPLQIEALNVAQTLCIEPYETVPVVHCLVRYNLFVKLQLKMVCDIECGWTKSRVMVRDDDRWITLEGFLRGLPGPTMPGYKQTAWNTQFHWWSRNGKFFDLMCVPEELRTQIFLFAIGEYIQPIHQRPNQESDSHSVCLTAGTPKSLIWRQYNKTSLPRLQPVDQALFSLSKATRETALRALWVETTKRYGTDGTDGMDYVFRGSEGALDHTKVPSIPQFVGPRYLGFMRRIQLAYSNAKLILLFGCPVAPVHDEGPNVAGPVLRALPNLRHLEIHFQSTATPSYNPWDIFSSDQKEQYDWVKWTRLPCTKVLHEWILLWAGPDLMHIPEVKLTGYIKTDIKKKWEGIIGSRNSERTSLLKWIEEEKESVRTLPRTRHHFPPRCQCPKPCGDEYLNYLHQEATRPRESIDESRPNPDTWRRAYDEYWFDRDDVAVREEHDRWRERDDDGDSW